MKKSVLVIYFMMCSFCMSAAVIDLTDESKKKAWIRNTSIDEMMVWFGMSQPASFDSIEVTDPIKRDAWIQKALPKMETAASEPGCAPVCAVLVDYYHVRHEYLKSVHWARKGAEDGSVFCCNYLADAYFEGNGVVIDWVEHLKWLFVSAALGETAIKDFLAGYEKKSREGSLSVEFERLFIASRQRAAEWQRQHPNAFNPYLEH